MRQDILETCFPFVEKPFFLGGRVSLEGSAEVSVGQKMLHTKENPLPKFPALIFRMMRLHAAVALR
jgi:hypothetical protein